MNLNYFFSILSFGYFFELVFFDFQVLQQNVYNENNRYLKWGVKHQFQVFSLFSFLVFCSQLGNLKFQNSLLFWSLLLYGIGFYERFQKRKKQVSKIPLKVTPRLKRLCVTLVLVVGIFLFLSYFFFDIYIFYVVLSGIVFFHFFLVYLCLLLNTPIEKFVFFYYKRKAKQKLSSFSAMKVIGITGSYGKTSSKNILNDILNVKFNSFATPYNYNTQYGLMITINQYLDKFEDIFIAEMGAYKRGRIRLCCDLVKPCIGILTSIGTAHLETFGSQENIQKGKFELIESLPSDGLAVLNKDDVYQTSYSIQNTCQVVWISTKDETADIYAKDICMSHEGMCFDVVFKKQKKTVSFSTKLLGVPNVYNILAGLAVGEYLGLGVEEMQLGVHRIQAISHRLELKNHGDYTILDDAYNSNPVGAKMALDVLALMDGKRVVVTPGMVELGEEQKRLNETFGEQISEVADYVILVGEKQTRPIYEGLQKKGFLKENIMITNDVKKAIASFPSLKSERKHTYFLLENDLPDIYNE